MGSLVTRAIYPIPKASYEKGDFVGVDRIFSIKTPHYKKSKSKKYSNLTTIFVPYLDEDDNTSPYILLYFHANAEDIGLSYDSLLFDIRTNLKVNVLSMEYPGYGLYQDNGKPNSKQIEIDAERLYQFALTELNFPEQSIILFGRSIGGGPVSHLAYMFKPRAVIYFMCFATLRKVAENYTAKIFSKLVPDSFRNIDLIKEFNCPILIIHGKKDKLVPFSQAQDMWNEIQRLTLKPNIIHKSHFSDDMSHGSYYLMQDLLTPMENFFIDNDIELYSEKNKLDFIQLPLFKLLYADLAEDYDNVDANSPTKQYQQYQEINQNQNNQKSQQKLNNNFINQEPQYIGYNDQDIFGNQNQSQNDMYNEYLQEIEKQKIKEEQQKELERQKQFENEYNQYLENKINQANNQNMQQQQKQKPQTQKTLNSQSQLKSFQVTQEQLDEIKQGLAKEDKLLAEQFEQQTQYLREQQKQQQKQQNQQQLQDQFQQGKQESQDSNDSNLSKLDTQNTTNNSLNTNNNILNNNEQNIINSNNQNNLNNNQDSQNLPGYSRKSMHSKTTHKSFHALPSDIEFRQKYEENENEKDLIQFLKENTSDQNYSDSENDSSSNNNININKQNSNQSTINQETQQNYNTNDIFQLQ